MGVNSPNSDSTFQLVTLPFFRVLREGPAAGKFRTLDVLMPGDRQPAIPGSFTALPGGKGISIRREEPFSFPEDEQETKRFAVKGLKPGERGVPLALVSEEFVLSPEEEFLWVPLPGVKLPDKESRVMRISLTSDEGHSLQLPGKPLLRRRRHFLQINLKKPLPLMTGLAAALHIKGRPEPLPGVILWCGPSSPREWSALEDILQRYWSVQDFWKASAGLRGWCLLPPLTWRQEHHLDYSPPGGGQGRDEFLLEGSFLFSRRYKETLLRQITKRSRQSGGFPLDQLSGDLKLSPALTDRLVSELRGQGALCREGAYLLPPLAEREGFLSPVARKVLSDIRQTGTRGLARREVEGQGLSAVAEELQRTGLILPFGEGGLISREAWEEALGQLTRPWKAGQEIRLADLKENLSLSRRELLPLLDEIDARGLFRWDGDRRFYQPFEGDDRVHDNSSKHDQETAL